jgi:predicted 3-demethylubiquinone-9 3-methyltransferase (glyoxalase superfamily)
MLLNATSSPQDHGFDFSPATSIVAPCETQAEIDHYWDRLCEGGQPGRCGWLENCFGVSWQIVPAKLPQWVADPERRPRVVEAFLQMQKFDIAALMRA